MTVVVMRKIKVTWSDATINSLQPKHELPKFGLHPQHTLSHSDSSFSLRNFVAEEDGFSAAVLKSVDKGAFLAAQRQALAAFDDAALARALQASEETATEETKKRSPAARVLPSVERTPPPPPPSAPSKSQSNPNMNHDISRMKLEEKQRDRLPVCGV